MMKIVVLARALLCLSPAACGPTACNRQEPTSAGPGPLRTAANAKSATGAAVVHSSPVEPQGQQGIADHASVLTSPTAESPSGSPSPTPPQSLTSLLALARRSGSTDVAYVKPTADEAATYEAFVAALLSRAAIPSAHAAPPRGFRLQPLEDDCLALIEVPDARRGAVALVVRNEAANAISVEVPHSFFDETTLPIGKALFSSTRAKVLLVNTVHRYRSRSEDVHVHRERAREDEPEDAVESDAAHAQISYFQSAHIAFGRRIPEGMVLQVHGYADASAPTFDAIVSAAGTATNVAPLVAELRNALGLKVAEYPRDVRRLGGTKNVQAAWSRRANQRFIHLELSQTLRKNLDADRHLRERFATSVAKAVL